MLKVLIEDEAASSCELLQQSFRKKLVNAKLAVD
jgi:hypothetical protein